MSRRHAWFDSQLDLDPEHLVFIDETWASTNMARRHGRAPRGKRLRMSGLKWPTTTVRLTSWRRFKVDLTNGRLPSLRSAADALT